MTGCYLDSNLIIALKDADHSEHAAAQKIAAKLAVQKIPFFLSPLCLDEFIYALKYLISRKQIGSKETFAILTSSLKSLLAIPDLRIVATPINPNSQLKVLALMEEFTLGPRDAYHLVTILENKIDSFATFDTDFKKVFAAKLVNRA